MGKGLTKQGGKYTSKHTTVTEEAAPICDFLHGLKEVTKISLAIIRPRGSSNSKAIKVLDTGTSLRVTIAGGSTQKIYVFATDRKKVISKLQSEFGARVKT